MIYLRYIDVRERQRAASGTTLLAMKQKTRSRMGCSRGVPPKVVRPRTDPERLRRSGIESGGGGINPTEVPVDDGALNAIHLGVDMRKVNRGV